MSGSVIGDLEQMLRLYNGAGSISHVWIATSAKQEAKGSHLRHALMIETNKSHISLKGGSCVKYERNPQEVTEICSVNDGVTQLVLNPFWLKEVGKKYVKGHNHYNRG